MKKLLATLIFGIFLMAGCNTDVASVKDTFVKVYTVVGQTIPVLEEVKKLEYIKDETVKANLTMVIDGLVLVHQKIGTIAVMLGIQITPDATTKDLNAIAKLNSAIESLKTA